jgi:hypothetical protein
LACPQLGQNFDLISLVPQFLHSHTSVIAGFFWPQLGQNFDVMFMHPQKQFQEALLTGIALPHSGQNLLEMPILPHEQFQVTAFEEEPVIDLPI